MYIDLQSCHPGFPPARTRKKIDVSENLVRVTICDGATRTILARKGASLLDTLQRAGATVTAACGGRGRCKKCGVTIAGTGTRLACRHALVRDTKVALPRPARATILVDGPSRWRGGGAANALRSGRFTPARPGVESRFGLAIDIGTTTVVVYLEDLNTAGTRAIESFVNPQSVYGHDVVARIHHCMERRSGLRDLRECLIATVNESVDAMCRSTGVKRREIREAAIVGNPTMLHLFLGVNPASIALAPYKPAFTASRTTPAGRSGLRMNRRGVVHVLPGVSGYVGADITAGIACTPLVRSKAMCLYVDIGTNGEMAVGNKDGLWCCASAAGPAFEGASIGSGVGGVEGAICSFDNGRYRTIGGTKPLGICGSGIVDIVAWLLDKGIVDRTGYMETRFVVENGARTATRRNIAVTPQDIRQIQLAKAAIAAGISILLKTAGIVIDDIESLFLAGAFGASINVKSAVAIGMIPHPLRERVVSLGNAAGTGARSAVRSKKFEASVERIAAMARYVELSGREDFNEEFVGGLGF